MPLSNPAPRKKLHTRSISIEGFQREDGLWDIEGTLTDVKTYDMPNAVKQRPAGTFHHEMRVRMTIDTEFNVRDIEAKSDGNPYDDYCSAPEPDYRKLVGLNLKRGFRKAVQESMGGVRGCTHINELLGVMPTGAFQTVAGTQGHQGTPEQYKMVLDRCAAWDTSQGPRSYFPTWFTQGQDGRTPR